MSKLRTRMIDDMTLRGMAAKTQDGYVRAVAQLAVYYHRSPDRISDREVQAYLLYLMRERKLSWSSSTSLKDTSKSACTTRSPRRPR